MTARGAAATSISWALLLGCRDVPATVAVSRDARTVVSAPAAADVGPATDDGTGTSDAASDALSLGPEASEDAARDTPETAPPLSIVTPLPELCRVACSNALKVVTAELPAGAGKAMREEIERAMVEDCPGRCLRKASMESARCIAAAKTALELATCQ